MKIRLAEVLTALLVSLGMACGNGAGGDASDGGAGVGGGPAASGGGGANDGGAKTTGGAGGGGGSAGGSCGDVAPIIKTCTQTTCDALQIQGETIDTNVSFHGDADPCLRLDPDGQLLRMLYSFPMVLEPSHTPVVEIHEATSSDRGAHWTFAGPVWKNALEPDDNYASHEVSAMAPHVAGGKTTWFGISFFYEVAPGSGMAGKSQLALDTGRFILAEAGDPLDFDKNPIDQMTFTFGGTQDVEGVALEKLYPAPSSCPKFTEPTLVVEDDVLFLLAGCEYGAIGVFAARISGPMSSWSWKYLGDLFEPADPGQFLATGKPSLTELDVTKNAAGTRIAIFTVMDEATGIKYGSRTADIATLGDYDTLAKPAMVRDCHGKLVPTGEFTMPPLADPPQRGPDASAYEALVPELGVVQVWRWYDNGQADDHTIYKTGKAPD